MLDAAEQIQLELAADPRERRDPQICLTVSRSKS